MISRDSLKKRRKKGLERLKFWRCETFTKKSVGKAGTTPCPCSCVYCANPRRTQKGKERLTLQEKRLEPIKELL